MHFSIPDTTELTDRTGSTYIAFNVHANGLFHCQLRYRQLHTFHEQLKKVFGTTSLPYFPPKKFLPMNASQIEERRVHLEKFIQTVSQNSKISNSEVFNGFFLSAQADSSPCKFNRSEEVPLTIYVSSLAKGSCGGYSHRSRESFKDSSTHAHPGLDPLSGREPSLSDGVESDMHKVESVAESDMHKGESVADSESDMHKGEGVVVTVSPSERTSAVLEQVLRCLGIPDKLMPYFSLYIRKVDADCDGGSGMLKRREGSEVLKRRKGSEVLKRREGTNYNLVRRLENFESPYLTLVTMRKRWNGEGSHEMILRTSYWDPSFDRDLFSTPAALDILYRQAHAHLISGLVPVSKEVRHQFKSFQKSIEKATSSGGSVKATSVGTSKEVTSSENEAKKGYLGLARTLQFYNYIHFLNCISSHPVDGTHCTVSVGGRELVLRTVQNPSGYSTRYSDGRTVQNPSGYSTRYLDAKTVEVQDPSGYLEDDTNASLIPPSSQSDETDHYIFRVTRIRCWRLTSASDSPPGLKSSLGQSPSGVSESPSGVSESPSGVGEMKNPTLNGRKSESGASSDLSPCVDLSLSPCVELSFEYLMNSDELVWITIKSSEAILISMCLQGMVQELILKRKGGSTPPDHLNVIHPSPASFSSTITSSVSRQSLASSSVSRQSMASSASLPSTLSSISLTPPSRTSNVSKTETPTTRKPSKANGSVNGEEAKSGQNAKWNGGHFGSDTVDSSTVRNGSHPLANGDPTIENCVKFDVKRNAVRKTSASRGILENDAFDGIGDDDL